MMMWHSVALIGSIITLVVVQGYNVADNTALDTDISDSLLDSLMMRRLSPQDVDDMVLPKDRFQTRMDDILLGREPNIRDQEYLEHSSLWGHQYMQGGAGEGSQHLKPDGSISNMQVIKTDSVLPAYCNPPNPCPVGYTREDGCLEEFSNTAAFSQEYQAGQDCMCDSEHMFNCPGNNDPDSELDTLARSFQNNALNEDTVDRFADSYVKHSEGDDDHKVVAKKYFSQKDHDEYLDRLKKSARAAIPENQKESARVPWMEGELTPKVIAKKSPVY